MDLFDAPTDNPLKLARALERQHEEARVVMRKGREYLTLEKRSANLLRWYASNKMGTQTARVANEMLRVANDKIYRQGRKLYVLSFCTLGYVVLTLWGFAWLLN